MVRAWLQVECGTEQGRACRDDAVADGGADGEGDEAEGGAGVEGATCRQHRAGHCLQPHVTTDRPFSVHDGGQTAYGTADVPFNDV